MTMNWKNKIVTLTVLLFIAIKAIAQNDSITLTGYVFDNFTHAGIGDVKVYLMTKDSVVLDSTTTVAGNFWHGGTQYIDAQYTFIIKNRKTLRKCIVKTKHHNFQTASTSKSLRYPDKNGIIEMPDLFLKRRNTFLERNLDDVTVTATKVQFYYKGDTLVYNADAFNVADGSMLDALIKQLPDVELNKNGEIFVKGRKVQSLLLNGEDFFGDRRKLMLENLPYYTVKDIKVYNRTSEKALALKDETAPKDFVMDVQLKKQYRKGEWLALEVGAGTEDSYLARLFAAHFTDNSRTAIVGGLNNLNTANYSNGGYWSSPYRGNGRTANKSLDLEDYRYNKKRKNVFSVSVSHTNTDTGTDEYQETFHSDDMSTFGVSHSTGKYKTLNASAKNHYTLKQPFWFESVTELRYGNDKSESEHNQYESKTDTWQNGMEVLDSLFRMGVSVFDPQMQNARRQVINSKSKAYTASQELSSARRVFNADIIDFNVKVDYTKKENDTERFNRYLTFIPSQTLTDITESIDRPDTHLGAMTDIQYKLGRILKASDLSFYANYSFSRDKNSETIMDMTSSILDAENSFKRHMTQHVYKAGLDYRYWKKIKGYDNNELLRNMFSLSLPITHIRKNTSYYRYTVDKDIVQTPVFIEPVLSWSYGRFPEMIAIAGDRAWGIWEIGIDMSLKQDMADALSLITLPLTSDKLNIFKGNENLKNSSVWTTSLFWSAPLFKHKGYLHHEISYKRHYNRIVSTYSYNSGIYTHTPENINGTWDISTKLNSSVTTKIKTHEFRFKIKANGSYNRMKNFVIDNTTNMTQEVDNNEINLSLMPLNVWTKIFWNKIDVTGSATFNWRKSLNTMVNAGYSNALESKYELSIRTYLPLHIRFDSEISAVKRRGYSNDELNKLACEWDVSLSKSILKNKINLNLKAIDLLHQYKAVTYTTNERGIRETHAVTLPAYALFTVSFNFSKFPTNFNRYDYMNQ